MKTLFKIVAGLVALVLVLLVAGTVALRIYLPPEKAKALVLKHLSTQLKRQVELGSASVSLLSGLQMTGLKISESPDFSKGTFLSSEQFSLKIALLPLLFRKIIVRQIILTGPNVVIVRNADGKTFNFSDLTHATEPAAAPAATESKESLPFLLLVSRAEIQKGALHFVDRSPAKQSLDIAPFDLTLKNVSLTSPFTVQTSLHLKSKGDDIALRFAGQANLLDGSFLIKEGSLASRQTKVTLSGTLRQLKTPEPALDLKIDIAQLTLADLSAFFTLPAGIKINKPLKGSVSLKGDQKKIELQSQISLGSLRLDGHGHVDNVTGQQPLLAYHAATNAFPIEEILAYAPSMVPAGIVLKGNAQLSADLSGTKSASQFAVKGMGTDLRVAQGETFVKPAGVPLEVSLIGSVARMDPMKIVLQTIKLQLASNQMAGSGTYEAGKTQANINFTFRGSQWSIPDVAKLSPLLAPYNPTGSLSFEARMSGSAAAPVTMLQTTGDLGMASVKQEFYEGQNLQMKWSLTDVTPDLARVNGTASLQQGPGKILNVEKLAAGSRIGKIALAPIEVLTKLQKKGVLGNMNLPSFQSISFDSVIGDYVLRSGVVDIRTFDLNGKDLSVQNRGTVGLAGAQPINLVVQVKLALGAVGGTLGAIINDENGRPTIKFAATGSVSNPQVKLDTRETGKKAVEQVGQELMKNKDVQNAVDDLQKTFKGIFH